MLFGRSVIFWLLIAIVAIVLFFVAQWLIPLIFGLIGVNIPIRVVNGLSLLIAIGVIYGGYTRV